MSATPHRSHTPPALPHASAVLHSLPHSVPRLHGRSRRGRGSRGSCRRARGGAWAATHDGAALGHRQHAQGRAKQSLHRAQARRAQEHCAGRAGTLRGGRTTRMRAAWSNCRSSSRTSGRRCVSRRRRATTCEHSYTACLSVAQQLCAQMDGIHATETQTVCWYRNFCPSLY